MEEERDETMDEQLIEEAPKEEKKTIRDNLYSRIDYPLSSIDRFIKIMIALLVLAIFIGFMM